MAYDTEFVGQCSSCNKVFERDPQTHEFAAYAKEQPGKEIGEYDGRKVSHSVCPECSKSGNPLLTGHWYWRRFGGDG